MEDMRSSRPTDVTGRKRPPAVDGAEGYHTIAELLARGTAARPEHVAIEAPGQPALSYRELQARVNGLAELLHGAGVSPGSRVALSMPSNSDMSVALLAVTLAGTAAPLNPGYVLKECRAYLEAMHITHVLTADNHPTPACRAAGDLGLPAFKVQGAEAAPLQLVTGDTTRAPAAPWSPPDPQATAVVLLTSGSTAQPKRVPLTHRNLCASVRDVCASVHLGPEDRCLSMWEQFHIGGLTDLLLAPLASGGTVISGGTFDVDRFFTLLETHRPTWYQAVPTALNALVQAAALSGRQQIPSSLRFIRSVAAALSPELKAEVESLFGVPVIQTFGMTEASPLITSTRLPPAPSKEGSVGVSAGPEVAIMGSGNAMLPPGETGEVVTRGANVMAGYEDARDLNRELFVDGWFRTGDLGFLDRDGHLFLTGRSKDLINRGGEKISPQEVDNVLQRHPAVSECATFSIPHPTLGEDIAVAVVPSTRVNVSAEELQAFSGTHLAPFKVPRRVVFVSELPRTASRKVKRHALTQQFSVQTASGEAMSPRTPCEHDLYAIWKRMLRIDSLGVESDFADLGGDSITGVALLEAVQQYHGKPLPTRMLRRITTIADMAKALSDTDGRDGHYEALVSSGLSDEEARILLTVLAGGQVPALEHAPAIKKIGHGDGRPACVWCFNAPELEMARLRPMLPDNQVLYALYSGSGRLEYEPRVNRALSQYYAESLMHVIPEGPLFLAGNCRGAEVAIGMTRELEQRGRHVNGLCLIDYFDPRAFTLTTPQCILLGKQSSMYVGSAFHWGRPGWTRQFSQPPRVDWLEGGHGRFFDDPFVGDLWHKVDLFLQGVPPPATPAAVIKRYGRVCLRSWTHPQHRLGRWLGRRDTNLTATTGATGSEPGAAATEEHSHAL